jgi:hypothetical protein
MWEKRERIEISGVEHEWEINDLIPKIESWMVMDSFFGEYANTYNKFSQHANPSDTVIMAMVMAHPRDL